MGPTVNMLLTAIKQQVPDIHRLQFITRMPPNILFSHPSHDIVEFAGFSFRDLLLYPFTGWFPSLVKKPLAGFRTVMPSEKVIVPEPLSAHCTPYPKWEMIAIDVLPRSVC